MKNLLVVIVFVSLITVTHGQYRSAFNNQGSLSRSVLTLKPSSISPMDFRRSSASNQNGAALSTADKLSISDTMKYNMYGDLLNDDPLYNPKSSLAMVALRVTLANVTTLGIDHYIFNYDFSKVGFNSWSNNFKKGWEWDEDRFGMNYFFHPYSGGMYFNAARANGYSFFESVPFAFLGSLEWEYFGENTRPSYNDFINTPINGSFLGEIFYRLGSNILDDRTTGADRFFREFAVAVLSPTRFFSRLLHGDLTRLTQAEVYQKEPLNITLSAGYHRVNEGTVFEKGSNSFNINIHIDYGNPFEKRSRKPYDYFKIRTDLDFGVGRKYIDNITGYGLLTGGNIQKGNLEMLVGIFQHMNFFDNRTFELGTIAFGPGIIAKMPLDNNSSLYSNIHLAIVPFGGLSNRFGPIDTTQVRDYNYGGGAELKFEANYNIAGRVDLTVIGYYWWFHTFVGVYGNSYIGLIKPRIACRIFDNVSIGFEHMIYYSDRYPNDFVSVHSVRTEQKLYIQIYLEEFKFKK